jgi:L-fuconolactonase
MKSKMKIDAHQHFWRYAPKRDTWITEDMSVLKRDFMPQDLEPLLKAHHMDGCIAVQADQSEAETEFLLGLAAEHTFIKGVVGWVDLRAPNVGERLAYFSQNPYFKGVRHIVQQEPDDFLLRKEVQQGIGQLQSFGLAFDLLIKPTQLRSAQVLAQKFPLQTFVLDHLAKPYIKDGILQPWKQHIQVLAEQENVYCKLSGLVTEAHWQKWSKDQFLPYLEVALNAFGPDRLLFGSDWPVCLLACNYTEGLALISEFIHSCSPGDRQKMMGKNAVAAYQLK